MANMHLVTGYAGKPHVTAADHGTFWAAVIGSGDYVLDVGAKFAATIVSNNQIRIADGDLLMQGRHVRINNGETVELSIENGTANMQRSDLIVARYTKSEETGVEETNLVVILGTAAASSPADPEYITGNILNGDLQRDFPLFRVNLNGVTVSSIDALFTVIPGMLANIETLAANFNTQMASFERRIYTTETAVNAATKIKTGVYTGRGYTGTKNIITVGFRPKYFALNSGNIHLDNSDSDLIVWDDANPLKLEAYIGSTITATITNSGVELLCTPNEQTTQAKNTAAMVQRDSANTKYYWLAIG